MRINLNQGIPAPGVPATDACPPKNEERLVLPVKKVTCMLLVLCLCIGLCACGGTKSTVEQGTASPTAEQKFIAERVNKKLSEINFSNWQKLYKEFTGNMPRESEVTNVTHYQIDDFDGAAMDCYLVKVSADIAYWVDEASQQSAIENSICLFVDGTTNMVCDNITTDAMNIQHNTMTEHGRATYLVWIYANAQNGDFTGSYINDSETLTELSKEDLNIINELCFAEKEHAENNDNTVASDAAESVQEASSAGVLSKEELCGVYVSSQNATDTRPSKYQFNLDEKKAVCFFDYNKNEFVVWSFVYAWDVEGNILTVYDSVGEGAVVFEVVADNGQVRLKFIENTAGVLGGYPAFLSDLIREEE